MLGLSGGQDEIVQTAVLIPANYSLIYFYCLGGDKQDCYQFSAEWRILGTESLPAVIMRQKTAVAREEYVLGGKGVDGSPNDK